MMQSEFEALTKKQFTCEDYAVIETVYAYHPAVPNVKGKQVLADLFGIGGLRLINDMLPTAIACRDAERKLAEAEAAFNAARRDLLAARGLAA